MMFPSFGSCGSKLKKSPQNPLDSANETTYDSPRWKDNEAHSSSGLGRRPLKAEITGSNPVCATHYVNTNASSGPSLNQAIRSCPFSVNMNCWVWPVQVTIMSQCPKARKTYDLCVYSMNNIPVPLFMGNARWKQHSLRKSRLKERHLSFHIREA